jgi:hypothetical protein
MLKRSQNRTGRCIPALAGVTAGFSQSMSRRLEAVELARRNRAGRRRRGGWPLEHARGESEAGRWRCELGGACTRGEQEVTLGPRWSARRGRV